MIAFPVYGPDQVPSIRNSVQLGFPSYPLLPGQMRTSPPLGHIPQHNSPKTHRKDSRAKQR